MPRAKGTSEAKPALKKRGPKPGPEGALPRYQVVMTKAHKALLGRIAKATVPRDETTTTPLVSHSAILRGLMDLVTPAIERQLAKAKTEEDVTAIVREAIRKERA